jgi:RNA polymerase sigma-70 factor (ECF subfamily)
MNIREQLDRIRQGDRQAFAEIVTHYQRPLFGYLGRMLLDTAQAEEVAQETFLRAWSKLAQFDPDVAAFSTWLFTIAKNLALHELGRASHRNESSTLDDVAEQACERRQPDAELTHKQQQQRLQAALHQLSLAERSALALAYIHEIDLAGVARIEACSVATIKVRLHRAKAKLKQLLEENHG